ncbi:Transposase and inactivated derivatives [hydrothermal vent metagenome]|uniref:Transposase and inactivated derivatives n=1 Tax=hydrothermal vent metagenome TaxID=652676 RepID=A0A3B0ZW50_9ZZZZ
MPRKPRFNLPGIPQHIIQRGNNRKPCFFTTQDYLHYLDDLSESASKFDCRVHAYVLMSNHVHLLVTPMTDNGLSRMMQAIGRRYVYYFNKSHNRSGTLWEGRYKSSLIDSDQYLLACMRYIELNPVRANIVKHPDQYPWSSYVVNASGVISDLVEPHPLYLELGRSIESRLNTYRELFSLPMNNDLLKDIRDCVNQDLVLGRTAFKDKVEVETKLKTRKGSPGRPRIEEDHAMYYMW